MSCLKCLCVRCYIQNISTHLFFSQPFSILRTHRFLTTTISNTLYPFQLLFCYPRKIWILSPFFTVHQFFSSIELKNSNNCRLLCFWYFFFCFRAFPWRFFVTTSLSTYSFLLDLWDFFPWKLCFYLYEIC